MDQDSFFNTGNGIADALLSEKQRQASAYNTIIEFNGMLPQDILSPTDLCVILGNTLDNAVEACQKINSDANKIISISCNCTSGFLFLTIRNPINESIPIHNNYVATTKENKTLHGFGLLSLHSVVKKYDGSVKLIASNNLFTANIELCIMSHQTEVLNE